MRADTAGGLERIRDPLVERVADAAAMNFVFDDHETDEIAARVQVGLHRIPAGKHAIEDEGHVVSLEKLGDSEHAARGYAAPGRALLGWTAKGGCPHTIWAREADDLLGEGEDTGFARNNQEAVMGFAAEPTGPVQTAIVKRTIEAVSCQRFGNETS